MSRFREVQTQAGVSFPFGLKLAQQFFRKREWERKKMVACYIVGNRASLAFNLRRTHPKAKRYGVRFSHIHAEQQAMLHMPKGGKIYVYRETHSGHIAMAKPCKTCMRMLKEHNVKIAYYSVANGFEKERL